MSLHLVEGSVIAARFRLVRRIGRGGMGEVWLAHDAALDVPCAVKLICAEAAASPELRARFELEARAAAQLRSAHVVQILDAGVFDGTPYIAMEHLEGEDLRERLKRLGVLDGRGTAAIIAQAARALGRAHTAGIVHRDLKPANLFLCRDGDREIVKVLDFGVAKRVGGAPGVQTTPGMLMGTLSYMSPEQAQGTRAVDHRSDLWALGVIAFRCLTGQVPFKSAAPVEVLTQIVAGVIPVPSRIAPVPTGFDTWWARAASRDPQHRFQSARELADALQMALGLWGTLDLERLTPADQLRRLRTTLPVDQGREVPSPSQLAAPPVELPPPPVRAPATSLPCTPIPLVASMAPVVSAPATGPARAKIAAAVAALALGALIAGYVAPRPAASVTRAQAGHGSGAPAPSPSIVALAVAVTAADTPSAAPPPPPPAASSATAWPRAVAPLPPATMPSASFVRPNLRPPAPPARSRPPADLAFDPGI